MFNIFFLTSKLRNLNALALTAPHEEDGQLSGGAQQPYLKAHTYFREFKKHKSGLFGFILSWLPLTPHFYWRVKAAAAINEASHKIDSVLTFDINKWNSKSKVEAKKDIVPTIDEQPKITNIYTNKDFKRKEQSSDMAISPVAVAIAAAVTAHYAPIVKAITPPLNKPIPRIRDDFKPIQTACGINSHEGDSLTQQASLILT